MQNVMENYPLELIQIDIDLEGEHLPTALRLWVDNFGSEPDYSNTDDDGDTFARGRIDNFPAAIQRVGSNLEVTFLGDERGNIVDEEIVFLQDIDRVRETAVRTAGLLLGAFKHRTFQLRCVFTKVVSEEEDQTEALQELIQGIALPANMLDGNVSFDVLTKLDLSKEFWAVTTATWRNGRRFLTKVKEKQTIGAVGLTAEVEPIDLDDLDNDAYPSILDAMMRKCFAIRKNGYAAL